MAGATATGAEVARHSVASRSSAWPPARRARKSALAGAISTTSAQRASSMWPIAASAAGSHSSLRTLRPETAWKVVAVTNSRAAAVITPWTPAPRRSHHHLDLRAALAQTPHKVRTLVGGDAAGHAEKDALGLHGMFPFPQRLSHRVAPDAQTERTSGAEKQQIPGSFCPCPPAAALLRLTTFFP